ncbi:MAG: acyl-CoA reductase [Candidatus Heimdallarchaeota archaeon]
MKKEITVHPFISQPITAQNLLTNTIEWKDASLEVTFPTFSAEELLPLAQRLSSLKRSAHIRPLEDVLEIIDQVGALWRDPSYELRKEALEIVPLIAGQSKQLSEFELSGVAQLWSRPVVESMLREDLGSADFLEHWLPRGPVRLHAQPRGLVLHNLAGNSFSVSALSLLCGLITKNVNLVKLSHDAPYFGVKWAESIRFVDKKLAEEIAVLYWSGSRTEIYRSLFNSGLVDAVLAWGGLSSIETIRKLGYHFGIKIIDYGPKLSFSIISANALLAQRQLIEELTTKMSFDIVFWNQKACLSPRVVFIATETPSPTKPPKKKKTATPSLLELEAITYDFAKTLASKMALIEQRYPRTHLAQGEIVDTTRKRDHFLMHHELEGTGELFLPENGKANWTVAFLKKQPTPQEINFCINRFIIVAPVADINEIYQLITANKLSRFLQTCSLFGSEPFVNAAAEELSFLGVYRFPRVGEHNSQKMGLPWDGQYILQQLVRWVYLGFHSQTEQAPPGEEFLTPFTTEKKTLDERS